MNAKDLYNVNVSIGSGAINLQDVNTVNILSPDCNFIDRVRKYSDLDSLSSDMIGGRNSLTCKAAQILYSQLTSLKNVVVTNVGACRAILFSGTMTSGTITVIVNGVPYTQAYTDSKAATIAALATQLTTAGYTVVSVNDGEVATGDTALIISRDGITHVKSITINRGSSDTLKAGVTQFGYILENDGTFTSGNIHYQINGTGNLTGPSTGNSPIAGKNYFESSFTSSKAATLSSFAANLVENSNGNIAIANYTSGVNGRILWISALGKNNYIDILQIENKGVTDTISLAEGYFWDQTSGSITGENIVNALNASVEIDGSWLLFVAMCGGADHAGVIANQKALADWAEADKESFFLTLTQDAKAYGSESDTSSILGYTFSNQYQCCAVIVTKQYNRYHMGDIAYTGKIAPLKPGAYDTYALPLKGVEADYFTSVEQTIIKNKNGEFLSIYRDYRTDTTYLAVTNVGKCPDGEWVAIAVGAMWLKSLILYTCAGNQMQLNNIGQKLPFSKRGFAIQESWIRSAADQALPSTGYSGFLTEMETDEMGNVTGGYYIVYPEIVNISQSDREKGELKNVTIVGFLSGAIRHTTINIALSY